MAFSYINPTFKYTEDNHYIIVPVFVGYLENHHYSKQWPYNKICVKFQVADL